MTIHSIAQTIFSFTHIEGITLGASEEVDEVAGGANGMCVDRISEVGGRASEGPVVYGTMGCGQKKLLVRVAVPPAPVRVPSQRPLTLSVASVMSVTNDKGDNEMFQGAVHRSPGICLTAEENLS